MSRPANLRRPTGQHRRCRPRFAAPLRGLEPTFMANTLTRVCQPPANLEADPEHLHSARRGVGPRTRAFFGPIHRTPERLSKPVRCGQKTGCRHPGPNCLDWNTSVGPIRRREGRCRLATRGSAPRRRASTCRSMPGAGPDARRSALGRLTPGQILCARRDVGRPLAKRVGRIGQSCGVETPEMARESEPQSGMFADRDSDGRAFKRIRP